MGVLNQACQVKHEGNVIYWHDMALSSYEEAIGFLEEYGYVKRMRKGKYKGLYRVEKWLLNGKDGGG